MNKQKLKWYSTMLKFRQYLILEQKLTQSKNKLKQMIAQSVQQFRQDIKIFAQTGIKSTDLIIAEDIKDVFRLKNTDLHQTERNKRALTKFLNDFEKLNNQEQMQLVEELSKPLEGKKYIQNNNEVKLILIYNRDKNSLVGQEAFNRVVMNKEGLFKQVAQEKVMKKQLRSDQAADYVQEMFATLCGGGYYNEQNGGQFSIDAYDPFSGVPFTSFVKEKVIPSAYNKFLAVYNTSVAGDLVGQKEGTTIISTDATINRGDSDDKDMTVGDYIEDETELGRDPSDVIDEKMKKQLIIKALTDAELPKQYRLTDTEKNFIKLHYLEGLGKKDAARKLGYKEKTAASVARRYLGDEKNGGTNGVAFEHLLQAVNYLMEKQRRKQKIE